MIRFPRPVPTADSHVQKFDEILTRFAGHTPDSHGLFPWLTSTRYSVGGVERALPTHAARELSIATLSSPTERQPWESGVGIAPENRVNRGNRAWELGKVNFAR